MATADDALCREVLGHLGGMDRLSSRPMFGGIGLYCGSRIFGIVFRGALYLRADESMRAALAREGARPFCPYRGRTVAAYWELPAAVMGDKRRVRAWARRAIAASDAAAGKTPGGGGRRPPKKPTLAPRRLRPRK